MQDPEVRFYYEHEKAKEKLAQAVHVARSKAHLTQAALAKKIGTSQSVIARLESGKDSRMPSMPLLSSIAKACGGFLEIGFRFSKSA